MAALKSDFMESMASTKRIKWRIDLELCTMFETDGRFFKMLNTIVGVGKNGGYVAVTIDKSVWLG